MFGWDQTYGPVRLAFTDRFGGASAPPYDEFNLGGQVGDDPAAVEVNRELLARAFGLAREHVLFMDQVHGAGVAVVDGPWDPGRPLPRVDALVTAARGLALAVLVADCAPVLLADPVAGVVAAAHAGRTGLVAGVIDATLDAMAGLGADPSRIIARVGPTICGACYEVPAAMAAEVAAAVPGTASTTRAGTAGVDVRAGVLGQLTARRTDVAAVGPCTYESAAHFSYRRAASTGRCAGIVSAGAARADALGAGAAGADTLGAGR